MTATTSNFGTGLSKRILEGLRRVALGTRSFMAAFGPRWRAFVDAGQLGPDSETIIGRNSGARI
jgi:hypothetical protein